MVACDLVAIRSGILEKVRERLAQKFPEFHSDNVILSATHTHTVPVMITGKYTLPKTGVIQPTDYVEFLCDRIIRSNGHRPGNSVNRAVSATVSAMLS